MLKIVKEDFNEYQQRYGTKNLSPQAEAIRDNRAYYYIIYDNKQTIADFVIFIDDDNWFGIDNIYLTNDEILSSCMDYLKSEFDYITMYIPSEENSLISMLKSRLNVTKVDEICQVRPSDKHEFYYQKLYIKLK